MKSLNKLTAIFVIHIIIFISGFPVFGQCDYSTCSTPTYTISSPLTISGSVSWYAGGASGPCVVVSDVVTITGTLTIDAVDCKMDNDGRFVINNGGELIILAGTEIYALNDGWGPAPNGGIRIKGGGTLTANDGSIIIAESYKAVNADADGNGEGIFELDGVNFCNNEIALYIGTYTSSMASNVQNCFFTAPNLPWNDEPGDYGIVMNGVKPGSPFRIGDAAEYEDPSTTFNEFTELNVAIRAKNSDLLVQDNYIHDLLGDNAMLNTFVTEDSYIFQTGVYSTGTGAATHILYVGEDQTGNYNNLIENADKGIIAQNKINSYIYYNKIKSDNDAYGNYNMSVGVLILNNCSIIDVSTNRITNFEIFGINIDGNPSANPLNVFGNIVEELIAYHPSLKPFGINIETSSLSTPVATINQNESVHVQNGIVVTNIEAPYLEYNVLYYEAMGATGSSHLAHGLLLISCPFAEAYRNTIYGTPTGYPEKQTGIYVDGSANFVLHENACEDGEYGIYITNTCTDGNMFCNRIEDHTYGFYLFNIGGTGLAAPLSTIQNPTGPGPSDNYWQPGSTANRVTTDQVFPLITNCSALDWNYTFATAYDDYDIPSSLTLALNFSTLPSFDDIGGDNECTSYVERPSPEAEQEYLIEGLENDYAKWAGYYNNEEIEGSPGTWSKLYSFWNRIINNGLDIYALSEGLQDLYNYIGSTNILAFDTLVNLLSMQQYEDAAILLDGISTTNDIEYYWKTVSLLFLDNINEEGIFHLSIEDESALRSMAELNGTLGGPGVYQARAMLDTLITNEPEVVEEKLTGKEKNLISIAPNPAQTYVSIFSTDLGFSYQDVTKIILFDLMGKVVKTISDLNLNTYFIGDLPNGIYFIELKMSEKSNQISKLVIQK